MSIPNDRPMYRDQDIKQIFAERLKGLREAAGLTQGELAERLGVSRGSISYYETQERVPDIVFLNRVSEYFEVGVAFLMGASENQNPTNEDLGSYIGFSDAAISKLLWLDCGHELSYIIEHEKFEKLFDMASYFFLADINRNPLPTAFRQLGDEYEYSAFQVSRVFVSILSDLKKEITDFMYEKFSGDFSKDDAEKKQFLSEKVDHVRDTVNYLLQRTEMFRREFCEQLDQEFEIWKSSDEYKSSLRIRRAVSDYVAQESSSVEPK